LNTINPNLKTNFFGPKGPPRFFASENRVAKRARIFTKLFFLVSIHINLKFPER
jgi:hypothetical protein